MTLNKKEQVKYLAKHPSKFHDLNFYDYRAVLTPEKELFSKLKAYREKGVVCVNSVAGSDSDATKDDKIGIVKKHIYNVRDFRTVTTADGRNFDLVCVANPWGYYETKSTGPTWHDKGPAWKRFPKVFEQIEPDFIDDGVFWMNFSDDNAYHNENAPGNDDFLDYYGMIFYAKCKPDSKPDIEHNDESDGEIMMKKGCFKTRRVTAKKKVLMEKLVCAL